MEYAARRLRRLYRGFCALGCYIYRETPIGACALVGGTDVLRYLPEEVAVAVRESGVLVVFVDVKALLPRKALYRT
jgi:hypothetical protein